MVHGDNQSPNSNALPDLTKKPFIRSSALNESTVSAQAHTLHVPLHCLEVGNFCVLSRIENSGPAPAHRVPSVHQQEKKKNHCFALPCSSGGCSFPGSSPYLCPTNVLGQWPCRDLPWPRSERTAPGPR